MNPSFADNNYLDNTLYNVKSFLNNLDRKNEIHEFIVLNLFPIRTPKSDNLDKTMSKYEKQQQKNDVRIDQILNNVHDVIVAWGSKYHNIAIKKDWFINQILKNNSIKIYAYDINKKSENVEYGFPKHFSPFAYKYKDIDFKNKSLLDYQVKVNDDGLFEKIK